MRRSWIVEAPAGSGKTGLLIQRYLKLLADESVDEPGQVLAITFTKKATTEIRERVVAQLEAAARKEATKGEFELATRSLAEAVLERDRELGWGLLENPRRLKMQTIDSVCAEIVRALPVLSGGAGGQAPVEDASMLYREAARRTLMELGGSDASLNDSLRTVLLHRDGNLAECEQLIGGMLALRDQWGELVPLGRELDDAFLDGTVLPKLQLALERAICEGLTYLSKTVPDAILQELAMLAGEMGHAPGYNGEPSPIAMCAGLHDSPGETAEHLEHWRALIHLLIKGDGDWRVGLRSNWLRFELDRQHGARLREILDSLRGRNEVLQAIKEVTTLPPAVYPQEQWLVAKALFRVLRRALAELEVVFAERGECDFAQLGLLAKAALQREGGVEDLASALGMRLQHLLVDEMQDTSTNQYALIELLTQGWDGQSQTVFLVGDPKQSIYLFRQARVERFVRTMLTERLGELPVGCLRLTANFRSQSELVEEFNRDFSLLFPREVNEAHPEEVPYVEAQTVVGATQVGGRGAVWHAAVLPFARGIEETKAARRRQARADAEEVRAIAKDWLARPLPVGRREPWKIAVLVRSRNHLADIVTAFKREDGGGAVPFRAVDIEPLNDRQEVLDLLALTRALLHPADRVAWLAVLHAPWCGLGLAELHVLTGADDTDWAERCIEDVVAERGDLLSEDGCARLARVWSVMRAAAEMRARLTTSQWVERTWRSLGGDTYLKPEELVNARRYLALLDEVEEEAKWMDLALLQRRLKRLYAEAAVSAGAVDLMTIHGAKGLEWDVVMVPGLERQSQSNKAKLMEWNELDSADQAAAHVVLAPIAGKGEGSKELNAWLKSIDRAREAAERKRLFYVACTRAREELHLFAAPAATAEGGVAKAFGSLLAAAWPAAERHFDAMPVAPGDLVVMPSRTPVEDGFIGDLAAQEESPRPALLQRLPLEFDPGARYGTGVRFSSEDAREIVGGSYFERPEGSFEARSLGNAVHAFLEKAAELMGRGLSDEALLSEVEGWLPRIAAVLRGDGLPPTSLERLSLRVREALKNALQDAEGRWVLGARTEGASELGLTSWEERRRAVRLDRMFRAGSTPLAAGDDVLWIVDYKTTDHGRGGVEAFLEGERAKYGPQMEAYARMVRSGAAVEEIRVGLYYPMLPKLLWWRAE